jgi:hypothetical protein
MRRVVGLFALAVLAAALPAAAAANYDVVVYGATPGGIAAALAAARLSHTVALIDDHDHIGGMAASGLGKSDVETREAISGLFREFAGRVRQYYASRYGAGSKNVALCRDGYYYEPSVAEKVFRDMVATEKGIHVLTGRRLVEVGRAGRTISSVRVSARGAQAIEEYRAKVFIDGTYEGDLAAWGGARYRVGRESRAEFNELHAGVIYQDYETRTFLPGSNGEGDRRVQAYTFRLCLTTDPANSAMLTAPPPDYDRQRYLGYVGDWKAGRLGKPRQLRDGVGYYEPTFGTLVRALSMAELPNGKLDVNMNPRPLGFPFCEINYAYPEAGWAERDRITTLIRNITLGLLYFLQNDPDVPAAQRELAWRFNLARDEFTDNGNFPWQLYVREARRIAGLYTLSERDVTLGPELGRTPVHADSIAAGEFPIDSFPVRKYEPGHDRALEGYILMLDQFTRPYQIPYRIMVPEATDALLVPVAASATHVAFSTIRLEPTWMAMGQAAGVAAHLAIQRGVEPRQVPVESLQRILLSQGHVLTYFSDIDHRHPAYAALQYFGTKGFFSDYQARPDDALDTATANRWLALAGRTERFEHGVDRASFARMFPHYSPTGEKVTRGDLCLALYAAR